MVFRPSIWHFRRQHGVAYLLFQGRILAREACILLLFERVLVHVVSLQGTIGGVCVFIFEVLRPHIVIIVDILLHSWGRLLFETVRYFLWLLSIITYSTDSEGLGVVLEDKYLLAMVLPKEMRPFCPRLVFYDVFKHFFFNFLSYKALSVNRSIIHIAVRIMEPRLVLEI